MGTNAPLDIDTLWNFSDPAGTEAAFRSHLQGADAELKSELLTQIARTLGLRRMFEEAHAILDGVQTELPNVSNRIELRYRLERGRTWNSSGKKDQAKEEFLRAYEIGRVVGDDTLTIDAVHMLAIVEEPQRALEWNLLGIKLAKETDQEKAKKWIGSISNNLAWTYHDLGDYDTAMEHFVGALDYFKSVNREPALRIARWAVARCQRSQGKFQAALDAQLAIAKDYFPEFRIAEVAVGTDNLDGYIPEEIAENLLAMDREEEARPYFAVAYDRLSQDSWLSSSQPDRLARLKSLGS